MKLKTDVDKCIASGACWQISPDLFEQGEDGTVRLRREVVDEAHLREARDAAAACPAGVITLEDS
jgi:ferredoxin